MSDQLKPCPFCGTNKTLKLYTTPFVMNMVRCDWCGATVSFRVEYPRTDEYSHEEVVKLWNTRKEAPDA